MDRIECIFCKSSLPAKLDAGFEKHMKLHKAEFNMEFIFASMLLDPPLMEKTIEFMLSLNTSKGEAEDKKKAFRSFFMGKTELKEECPDVKDNIIDDEAYEKLILSTSNTSEGDGNANEERNLERLIMIQDDSHGSVVDHDHPLEENSFPSPAVTGQEDKEVLQQPKRKRGRPRKGESPPLASAPSLEKKERCSCNIQFKSKSSLRRHMNKYHGQHACQLCSLTFLTEQELERHLENPKDKHDPDYMSTICFICGAQFKQYRFLKDHKNSVHELGEKRKCELCPEFVINLKKHLRKCHTELKTCLICQKPVKCLENHMLTMHGTEEDKKFRCEECGKGFILRDKLVAHKVVHSEEKPFLCRFSCGYASKTAGNRRKHEEGVHQMFVREKKKKPENGNIEASERVKKEKEKQGAIEMDQNVNKKNFDNESQNYGVGDVSEEDIDLEDLEEVTVTSSKTEGEGAPAPVNVEIQAGGLGPTQLIQVNLPLSQILTSSLPSSPPPVSELSDQANQEYQEICSFFQ